MKIALVCPYDWSRHGGVQAHVRHLARVLADDHEVQIFAPAGAPVARDDPRVPVVRVGGTVGVPFNRSVAAVGLSPLTAAATVRALRRFRPHVVHVHEPLAPAVSLAATRLGPGPVVATYHAWSSQDRLYRLAGPPAGRTLGRVRAHVAVSPAAQRYAAGALGISLGAFRVVPNGVDIAQFTHAEPIPDLVDPARPLLLFVGRLEPRKGLDVLVRAWLRLRARRPQLRLCVVGDGPERQRCQQMVPSSLRPDVLFVGSVAEADKARYHASADVYVAPNTTGESFGIVLLEAMAAGLPVVAADIPGFRSVVTDGRDGRLFPPGDAPALATALDAILENEKLRRAIAEEGRRTATTFDWPVVAGSLLEIYHQVIRAPG